MSGGPGNIGQNDPFFNRFALQSQSRKFDSSSFDQTQKVSGRKSDGTVSDTGVVSETLQSDLQIRLREVLASSLAKGQAAPSRGSLIDIVI